MRTMRPLILLFACLQRAITPGDASLRVDRVRLATDTILVLARKPKSDEQVITTLVRQVERPSDDILRVVQRYESPDGEWEVDTIDVNAQTLALRRSVEIGATTWRSLRFDGKRLTGTFASDGAKPEIIDMAVGPFFPEVATEVFIGTYPLRPGSAITFPELGSTNLKVQRATLAVDSASAIATADGWIDCLVAHGPAQETLWLARSDGHLLREQWTERDGTIVWKIPRRDVPFRREGSLAQSSR
jgi:hypothetical protein